TPMKARPAAALPVATEAVCGCGQRAEDIRRARWAIASVPASAAPGPLPRGFATSCWLAVRHARTLSQACIARRCSMRSIPVSGRTLACVLLVALSAGATPLFAQTKPAPDKIPITTTSDDARKLYLQGRDLAEKLRATDARGYYEQAV